jgi:hypothetical protein
MGANLDGEMRSVWCFQTVDNLKRKRWKGNEMCIFCLEGESVDHLLFRCPLVVYI